MSLTERALTIARQNLCCGYRKFWRALTLSNSPHVCSQLNSTRGIVHLQSPVWTHGVYSSHSLIHKYFQRVAVSTQTIHCQYVTYSQTLSQTRWTVQKLWDIRVSEISRVTYSKSKWLGLIINFDITIVFEISVFERSNFNRFLQWIFFLIGLCVWQLKQFRKSSYMYLARGWKCMK